MPQNVSTYFRKGQNGHHGRSNDSHGSENPAHGNENPAHGTLGLIPFATKFSGMISLPAKYHSLLKIGLLSDTHGHLDQKIFDVFKDVDEIWHAGDIGSIELCDALKKFKHFSAVYGNIDSQEIRMEYPLNLVMEREGLKILMTHIGGYPGHYDYRARATIEKEKPDIFICGHSHILKVMRDEKYKHMVVMNPGAAGVQGFHKMKTVLRFHLNNGKIEHLEAVELGKRGEIV